MKMKRILALLLFSLFIGAAHGQSRLAYSEFGIGVGTLNYSGDIATTTSTSALIDETRPNFKLMAKRNTNDWFAFGLQAAYGWVYASDLNHTNQARGLEVKTSMFQINPFIEMNLIRFGKFRYERKFSIYIKGGAGYLAYNPDPLASEVYPPDLDPQTTAYTSINYFFATGVKFRLGYKTILAVEADFHNAGADNLDGVLHKLSGQRGSNDTYGGITVVLSKMLF